jgi:hypothetical protein
MAGYVYAGEYIEGIFTNAGLAQVGLSVTIKDSTNTTNATLWTSRLKAAGASNPVTTDANGNLVFYADPGRYKANATISGSLRTWDVIVYPDASETFNVLSFGAKGDGTTDDTVAIQAVLDAVHNQGGGTVFLPGGTYLVSQLTIGHYTELLGVHHHGYGVSGQPTIIKQKSSVNVTLIIFRTPAATYLEPFGIRHITFVGDATNTSGHGIHTVDSTGAKFKLQDLSAVRDVMLRRFAGDGFRIEGASPGHCVDVETLFNGGFGINVIDDAAGDFKDVQQMSFTRCKGDGNLGGANLRFEGLTASAVVTITDCGSEQRDNSDRGGAVAGEHAVSFHNCAGMVVARGLYLLSNGTAGSGTELLKPGHLIVITGSTRPTIDIAGTHVRVVSTQVNTGTSPLVSVAADPVMIDDQVGSRQVPLTPHRVLYGTAPIDVVDGVSDTMRRILGGTASVQTVANPATEVHGGTPGTVLYEEDAVADEKMWIDLATSGNIESRTRTDAGAAGVTYRRINRTGTAVDSYEILTTDLKIGTAGKGIRVAEGTNARQGLAILAAGTVTVSTTAVTAQSRILLTVQVLGTVTSPKAIAVTARTAGTSFTITSEDATDTSSVAWEIFEPA